MPGLFGIVDPSADSNKLARLMERMEAALRVLPRHTCQRWVAPEGSVAIGKIGLELAAPLPAEPSAGQGPCVWIEGELFREDRVMTSAESVDEVVRCWLHCAETFARAFRWLDGSFHIAVWGKDRRELALVSDRLGTRPLYWAQRGDCLVFAPQVQGILASGYVNQEFDPDGLAAFLEFGSPTGNHTLMRDVQRVPPGSVMLFHDGQEQSAPYWLLEELFSERQESEEAARGEIEAAFQRSMARSLSGGLRTGLFLSAGMDTRVNLAGAAHRASGLHSFTYGIPGCTDIVIAERLAAEAGTCHHTLELEPDFLSRWAEPLVWMTDGMLSLVHSSGISVLEEIARHVDVVLAGDGGEFCRGYYHRGDARRGGSNFVPGLYALFHKGFRLGGDPAPLNKEMAHALAPRAQRGLEESIALVGALSDLDRLDAFYLYERFRVFAVCGLVMKRNFVECRAPLVDSALLEALGGAPRAMRDRWSSVHRLLLARNAPHLASYPFNDLGVPMNAGKVRYRAAKTAYELRRRASEALGLLWRPGRPYAHFSRWFRGPLREWVQAVLLDDQTRRRDIFDPAGLEHFLDDHLNGRRDHTEQIGILLALELGFRLRSQALNASAT